MNNIFNWISANQQIIYIVILMIFLGIEVIGRVPSVLHTPLMSGANAIHGVVLIGAIIVMGRAEACPWSWFFSGYPGNIKRGRWFCSNRPDAGNV
jgi:NAD(P) transhydrogenase subunit alpha